MTDKQIIIDGVDVSECKGICSLKNCCGYLCAMWNILKARQETKQLNQLKDVNKNLKDHLEHQAEMCGYNLQQLNNYKQAIEKIKELIQKEINDCEHCDDCESCEYNCCTKQILQVCDEMKDE